MQRKVIVPWLGKSKKSYFDKEMHIYVYTHTFTPPTHPDPLLPLTNVKITSVVFRKFLILEAFCAADK